MSPGALLDLLFPGRCLLCGEWLEEGAATGAPLCPACVVGLPSIPEPACPACGTPLVSEIGLCTRCRAAGFAFESSTALFPYTGTARTLLHCFKFEGRVRCAEFYAARAAAVIGDLHMPIVPVPSRRGRRGASVVLRVARALALRHGLEVRDLLERTGGAAQKTLDLAARRANLQGRVHVRRGTGEVPPAALLLDDVFTTGATLDACARALRDAGCHSVRCLTLVIEQ